MKNEITFFQKETFAASRAAEGWLRERGFSYGPTQCDGPQAVWFGECAISKWRNLSRKEKAQAHALITGDTRNGPVKISLTSAATAEAIAAFTARSVAA